MIRWLRGLVLAMAALAAGEPARAQIIVSSGGLFGESRPRDTRHKLDFTLGAVEAYDSDVPPEARTSAELLVSGRSSMLLGRAEYAWDGSRVQAGATGEAAWRRYNEPDPYNVSSYSVGAGISARLGDRTTLLANQSFAYTPSYLFALFPRMTEIAPGDTTPIAPDYDVSDYDSHVWGSAVTLTRGLTRRSQLLVSGDHQYTDVLNETALQRDLEVTGVRGAYERDIGQNRVLHVGYRYRSGTFGYSLAGSVAEVGASASEHGIEVGVRLSRPLSATRRLSFAFGVAPSTMDVPAVLEDGPRDSRYYQLSGSASFGWQMSRSWQVRAAARRGLEYIADLTQPVHATGASVDIGGLLTPRLALTAAAGYSTGASALDRSTLTFHTSSATVRAQYALTKSLAVYGEYLYYFYDFSDYLLLPQGFPPGVERNGVRAGLTLWVPALRK